MTKIFTNDANGNRYRLMSSEEAARFVTMLNHDPEETWTYEAIPEPGAGGLFHIVSRDETGAVFGKL